MIEGVKQMFSLLENYKGSLIVNEVEYKSVTDAKQAFKGYQGPISITLNPQSEKSISNKSNIPKSGYSEIYRIKVRQYMTKPSVPGFDFQDKWNGGVPMPMRIMVGRKLEETKGMVKMELWGEITEERASICMKCGRPLTNPVSRYFGIGPECGDHNYVNPFDSEAELKEAISQVQQELKEIRWTGWIIKSAIEEETCLGLREVNN